MGNRKVEHPLYVGQHLMCSFPSHLV